MKLTRKAFTLVELIIVIAIIAVLAVSAFMVLTKWLWKSRDSRRLGDLGAIETSLSTWLSDYDANGKGLLVSPTQDNGQWLATVATGSDFDDYFADLKGSEFDVLQKVVSDPDNTDQYVIAIAANSKFAVAATLEDDGNYKAAIRTNYQSGADTKDFAGATWSGAGFIEASDDSTLMTDGGTDTPYSLTD